MGETLLLVAGGIGGGCLLGALYFGALWTTVRAAAERGRRGEAVGWLMGASFLGRAAVACAGFAGAWWIAPSMGIGALLGFLLARYAVIVRLSRREVNAWS